MNFGYNQALRDLVASWENDRRGDQRSYWEERSYIQLIDYYEQELQFEQAIEVADAAIQTYAYCADFYLRKADHQIALRRYPAALFTLDEAAVLAPNDLELCLLRAEVLSKSGERQQAKDILDERAVFESRYNLVEVYYTKACILDMEQAYEPMFYLLKSALQIDPTHQACLELLWTCVEATRRHEESVEIHLQLIDQAPYSHLAWLNLGHAYAYLNRYDEALEAFEYSFLAEPNHEMGYREFADLNYTLKRYESARDTYLEMLERFPLDEYWLQQLGMCYQQLEDFSTARIYFNRNLEMDPLNDEILFQLGEGFTFQGEYQRALSYYKRAIAIEEEREEYFAATGEAYFQLQQYELADLHLRRAIDLAPQHAEYWIQYATFLLQLDRCVDAQRLMEEALNTCPEPHVAYCHIACLFVLGQRQEALYQLGEILIDEYEQHGILFEIIPQLVQDPDVIYLLQTYQKL